MFRKNLRNDIELFWEEINSGIFLEPKIMGSVTAHPSLPGVVIAVGYDEFDNSYIYLSKDNGSHWLQQSGDLNTGFVGQLKFAKTIESMPLLYLASTEGLFAGIIQMNYDKHDNNLRVFNYPNPFNPTTQINFQIEKDSYVKVKVFDMLGREIQLLVDAKLEKGSHVVSFDGSSLASGVYFYVIEADGYKIANKKMVLIK